MSTSVENDDCFEDSITTTSPHNPTLTYESLERDRHNFKVYLENHEVIDNVAKILTHLYDSPEKPNDSLNFLKNAFIFGVDQSFNDTETLKANLKNEIEDLKLKISSIKQENKTLQEKLERYED